MYIYIYIEREREKERERGEREKKVDGFHLSIPFCDIFSLNNLKFLALSVEAIRNSFFCFSYLETSITRKEKSFKY